MIMTDMQNPQAESDVTDAPEDALDTDDLSEDDEIVVDAMTGEVRTLTKEEAAAEEEADRAASAVAVAENNRISPELLHDPYGEEVLSTSKAEFEALLEEFSGGFQAFREGEIVEATVLRVTETAVILEFGFKSEGAVALDEFKDPPTEGEQVEVLLERTMTASSSSPRRRRTSCASGKRSGRRTRRIVRSRERSSARSRAASPSTSWASTRSCRGPRSRCVACRTSRTSSARSTSSRSSS
jgi:hypothetical protein